MWDRIAKAILLLCAGLALVMIGVTLRSNDSSTDRTAWRLVIWGGALILGGVVFLARGKLFNSRSTEDQGWHHAFGLYALAALSCGGSVFLVAYAMSKPDYRLLSLLIAAGTLIVGAISYALARRYGS